MKKCIICGKEISGKVSNNRKYCSEKCAREAEKIKKMGKIAKRSSKMQGVRHDVYRAFEHKCAICGWQISDKLLTINGKTQFAHGNQIHHIIPASEGGGETDDNLILLCPNCHKKADLGLISREQLKKYTRRLEMSEEEKLRCMAACSEAVYQAIMNA